LGEILVAFFLIYVNYSCFRLSYTEKTKNSDEYYKIELSYYAGGLSL